MEGMRIVGDTESRLLYMYWTHHVQMVTVPVMFMLWRAALNDGDKSCRGGGAVGKSLSSWTIPYAE